MKFILHFIILLLIATSCNERISKKETSGCYRMIIKDDTAVVTLNTAGDSVSGRLSYRWKEKDSNEGSIKGIIKNDSLIVANYNFQSEGVNSVREVVFKIKDSMLLQGYGEVQMKNDTAFFRDVSLVIFDTKHPFIKGCQ